MKIFQSCLSPSWGGLEMEALEISKKLAKKGHDVSLFCLKDSTIENESSDFNNIHFIEKNSSFIQSIFLLKKYFKNNKTEVVHTHKSGDLRIIVPALLLSGSNAKLFLTKHVASNISKNDLIHKILYKRVNKVFAVSSFIMGNILASTPVPSERIRIIQNGISLENYTPQNYTKSLVRKRFSIGEDEKVVGLIGRITPKKGHEDFITAAKILSERDETIRFLIIGSCSYGEEQYYDRIRNLVIENNLDSVVGFIPFQKNIAQILSVLDLLAFPSYEESFGNVLIEAMAMRIPTIAYKSAGVLDIISDMENGLLVNLRDIKALADGISFLMSNSQLRSEFSANGRKRVEDYFDISETINTLEYYYSEN